MKPLRLQDLNPDEKQALKRDVLDYISQREGATISEVAWWRGEKKLTPTLCWSEVALLLASLPELEFNPGKGEYRIKRAPSSTARSS